jgi:DNA-nicking Smr family endonuclease
MLSLNRKVPDCTSCHCLGEGKAINQENQEQNNQDFDSGLRYTSIITLTLLTHMVDDFMSDEDKALFREHMRSVNPLNEKTKRVQITTPKPPIPPKRRPIPEVEEKAEYYLSDVIKDTVLSQTTLSYAQSGLANQRFKALRNGQIPWEGRLDLHGLKSEKARDALCQFIRLQVGNGKRCLLIIHGKGGHEGAPPVIKNLVNRWLPQLDEILAFHSALPKDGGTGAVYVLLKRNRE